MVKGVLKCGKEAIRIQTRVLSMITLHHQGRRFEVEKLAQRHN